MKDKNINFALFILSTFGSVIMPLLLKKIKCTPLKNALQYLITILVAFVLIYIV